MRMNYERICIHLGSASKYLILFFSYLYSQMLNYHPFNNLCMYTVSSRSIMVRYEICSEIVVLRHGDDEELYSAVQILSLLFLSCLPCVLDT